MVHHLRHSAKIDNVVYYIGNSNNISHREEGIRRHDNEGGWWWDNSRQCITAASNRYWKRLDFDHLPLPPRRKVMGLMMKPLVGKERAVGIVVVGVHPLPEVGATTVILILRLVVASPIELWNTNELYWNACDLLCD